MKQPLEHCVMQNETQQKKSDTHLATGKEVEKQNMHVHAYFYEKVNDSAVPRARLMTWSLVFAGI